MGHKKHPDRAAMREFSQRDLARICILPEADFGSAYGMQTVKVPQRPPAHFYHYKDNGSQILAVAHLDTVAGPADRAARFVNTEAGPVVFSRALDDRLGAYIIAELMPRLGVEHDWLFTVGEERGQSTARHFEPPDGKEYRWMIEFDRGGTDVVMYQFEDAETRAAVRKAGAMVGEGIFSDVSFLDHIGVKGFNWGVGYENYHGPRSHAFLWDTMTMAGHYLRFYAQNKDVEMPHSAVKTVYSGGYAGGYRRAVTCPVCHAPEPPELDDTVCTECGSWDFVRDDFVKTLPRAESVDGAADPVAAAQAVIDGPAEGGETTATG